MTEPHLPRPTLWQSVKRNIFVGILALIPVGITVMLLSVVLIFLSKHTAPFVEQFLAFFITDSRTVLQLSAIPLLPTALAVLLLLLFFYLVGFLATRWLGRQAMRLIDVVMDRIPVAKSVYSAVKGVTEAMQSSSTASSKVVLIGFPAPELKTVGLVTKITTDSVTGEELAVVFVPTSPTPTSGYIEIVPTKDLVFTDWTVEEAMSFVISGGTDVPEGITLVPTRK